MKADLKAGLDGNEREAVYRGRQVAGLLIVAGGMLLLALGRARWGDLFPVGWWRIW